LIQKLASCWNLSDADVFRLRNTKELSVYRDDSCLAFGKISDVFRETVQEGTITTVAFSLGLDEPGICLKLTIEEVV